nr:hypothetical protein GCM10020093_110970 [Planobispora longispora]
MLVDMTTIQVDGLGRSYGEFEAVRDVSFTVEQGELFALLGRNGAGKTTTVEVLAGFRPAGRGPCGSSGSTRSRTAPGCAGGPGSCCRRRGSSPT